MLVYRFSTLNGQTQRIVFILISNSYMRPRWVYLARNLNINSRFSGKTFLTYIDTAHAGFVLISFALRGAQKSKYAGLKKKSVDGNNNI